MSYTKTTWASGDTVTAEKLNNMEGGIDAAANAFVVTLTPTALDYSGTMDKTVAEIYEAYQAGKKIMFDVSDGSTGSLRVSLSTIGSDTQYDYPSFNAYAILDDYGILINLATGITDDGTRSTYVTRVYALTPAT